MPQFPWIVLFRTAHICCSILFAVDALFYYWNKHYISTETLTIVYCNKKFWVLVYTMTRCSILPILKHVLHYYWNTIQSPLQKEFWVPLCSMIPLFYRFWLWKHTIFPFVFQVVKWVYKEGEATLKTYNVAANQGSETYTCSCNMFDQDGLLCPHILKVFTTLDVQHIP